MTRRRTVVCLALALVLAGSFGAGWVYLSDSRTITREQLERAEKRRVSCLHVPPRVDYAKA